MILTIVLTVPSDPQTGAAPRAHLPAAAAAP